MNINTFLRGPNALRQWHLTQNIVFLNSLKIVVNEKHLTSAVKIPFIVITETHCYLVVI